MKKIPTYTVTTCVVAAALALSGCGGSDSSAAVLPTIAASATTSPETTETSSGGAPVGSVTSEPVSADPDEAAAQYDRCMSDHGVKGGNGSVTDDGAGPDPTSFSVSQADSQPVDESANLTEEAFNAAIEACEPYLAAVIGDETVDPAVEAELADKNLEILQCLKDAGFDVQVDENGMMTYELPAGQDPDTAVAVDQQCNG